MKYNASDYIGMSFGRLTVVGAVRAKCECSCSCGGVRTTYAADLIGGKRHVSCGCQRRLGKVTNGQHMNGIKSLTARSYKNAKSRCNNPKAMGYHRYGGRGIEFRLASVEDLMADIGERPDKKHSLDRIDNEGHYEIGNVKWSTAAEQLLNTIRNKRITCDGQTKTISEWVSETGQRFGTLRSRIDVGWCSPCAIHNKTFDLCTHKKA